jgi:hypothetical protein
MRKAIIVEIVKTTHGIVHSTIPTDLSNLVKKTIPAPNRIDNKKPANIKYHLKEKWSKEDNLD